MKHRRPHVRHRPSRHAEQLARLALGLVDAGSRVEDAYWESALLSLIERLLQSGDDDALNQALDRLGEPGNNAQSRAYEALADLIEAACESLPQSDENTLMLALPVLAWSRYQIPARALSKAVLDALRTQLQAHVLARDVSVHFAEHLFSPDQLPQGYSATRAFAQALFEASASGRDLPVDADSLAETQAFISDVRYLVVALRSARHAPLFRWQESDGTRDAALTAWRAQGGPNLVATLTGCQFELLLPEAYFTAWRHADQATRPFALQAAAAYLQTLHGVEAAALRVIAAPYFEHQLEEWRISFLLPNSEEVVHGVTWPLLGAEDDQTDIPAQIEQVLRAAGLSQIQFLETRMPLEYCDDCGAPLFPNPEGENVHTETPEAGHDSPVHLH